jgi:hypothetical protein
VNKENVEHIHNEILFGHKEILSSEAKWMELKDMK